MEDDTWDFFDEPAAMEGKFSPESASSQSQGRYNGTSDNGTETKTEPHRSSAVKKIEAKVPRHETTSSSSSNSDTESDSEPETPRPAAKRDIQADISTDKQSTSSYSSQNSRSHSVSSTSDTESESFKSNSDESDVTDVSPLQTPAYTPKNRKYVNYEYDQYAANARKPPTPKQHPDVVIRAADKIEHGPRGEKVQQMLENQGGTMNMDLLMQAVLELDQPDRHRESARVQFQDMQQQGNKHYSFDAVRLQDIDRENKRLLERLKTLEVKKQQKRGQNKQPLRLTPSAVNRQKDLERIEKENFALLRRLQKARPTPNLQRNQLLKEYHSKTIAGQSVAAAHYRLQHQSQSKSHGDTYSDYSNCYDDWNDIYDDDGGDDDVDEVSTSVRRPQSAYPSRTFSSRPTSGKRRPQSAVVAKADPVSRVVYDRRRPAWSDRW